MTALHVVILAAFALLGIATVIAQRMHQQDPDGKRELWLRVKTWWWLIPPFALALLAGQTIALCYLGLISFLALKEYLTLIPTRHADRRVLVWAYLAIPLQYYWAAIGWHGMFLIFIPVYLFLLIPARMVLIGDTKGFLNAAGTLHWGLMTTVFSLSHLGYLLALPERTPSGGAGLVLFLVALTEFNDVMQYVWGKSLGRNKVLPTVSPGKTWAGLIGGVLSTALLAALLAPWLTPLHGWQGLGAGLLIGVAGFLGDVSISAIKRDLGIKDSGSLLPGHGGILDRVDSLTFSAPLFFHFLYYLHY